MKKIVVFSNMYPSQQHPTYGLFVKNQVELLQSADIDVDVVAIQNPGKGKIQALKKYTSWFFRSFLYMMKNRKNLSLTHAHYAFPTGVLSLIGKKMFGIPYVVTSHGGDIDKMAVKSQHIANMTRTILQQAESVIVVGDKLREDVIYRFGVPETNVHVMSMGVDTSVFKYVPRVVAREMLGLPIEEKMLIFVGNVIQAKGLLELVEAFDSLKMSLPESSLYVIGSKKDGRFVEELRSFIREKDVEDIHFKEPLSQADLSLWMSAADALVLPSHHEGFGLVALEAMSAGTKVVATEVGGLSYLLKDQAGILVEPKNPASLAEGLWSALDENSDVIDETVVQAKITQHSFDTILGDLLSIYRSAEKGQVDDNE
ncbi:glycosyltransferase family 4 protein [Sporosarcina sp. ANT_H38]|uniref:glycosyltransferase n=1 Tax=Sporosarcina sp. ANT_H38 TaxID=2597358 RepID=UPI0011F3C077|nr:glycosyltransferase [Sporosarcina sp. ANT_H38]KAA0966854.1 glycosyltransferase family 4 protein [Sporosarcina sp. ANT_H38]